MVARDRDQERKRRNNQERIDREVNPEAYEHNFKECSKCHQEKPLNNFYVDSKACMSCKNDHEKQLRLANLPKATWKAAKKRATELGREFTITPEDVEAVWTDTCPVYLIPLKTNDKNSGPDSYSLDRIDNSKGYVPGNIAIVSQLFNSQKKNLTPELLRRMLAYMEGRLLP